LTVSKNVAVCCNEPEITVAVMIDVLVRELVILVDPEVAPSQPANEVRQKMPTIRIGSTARLFFQPKNKNATAKADLGSQNPE
jgi:hypothetical protein